MRNKIIEAIEKCRSFDADWELNYDNLKSLIPEIHPDFYDLSQSCEESEVIYDKIIGYKPLILDPIKDKEKLKLFYNNIIDCKEDNYSCNEMEHFLELAFKNFNSDYIFYPEEIEEDREESFSFEEFYQLWLDKKIK